MCNVIIICGSYELCVCSVFVILEEKKSLILNYQIQNWNKSSIFCTDASSEDEDIFKPPTPGGKLPKQPSAKADDHAPLFQPPPLDKAAKLSDDNDSDLDDLFKLAEKAKSKKTVGKPGDSKASAGKAKSTGKSKLLEEHKWVCVVLGPYYAAYSFWDNLQTTGNLLWMQ